MTNKETKTFIKNGLKTVRKLMRDGNHIDAIKACVEILEIDPGNTEARTLIEKEKKQIVEKNFKTVKTLYKQGEYEEAITTAEKLLLAGPNRKLSKLILEKYLERGYRIRKELTADKKWLEAIGVMEDMHKTLPHDEKIIEKLRHDKIKYIDRELHSDVRKELISDKQFEKLYKFYKKLYEVFPEHKKLLKEIKSAEKLVFKARRESNKTFIEGSIAKTKSLLAEKKFDSAEKAARELIQMTDGDQGMNLYKKAATANDKDTEAKLDIAMRTMIVAIKEDFKKDPAKFVKI